MRNGGGKRISGVIGLGLGLQVEQNFDIPLHQIFVRFSRSCHRCFYLIGRVHCKWNGELGKRHGHHPFRLCHVECARHVAGKIERLHAGFVRFKLIKDSNKAIVDSQQARSMLVIGRGLYYAITYQSLALPKGIHNTKTCMRKPRIYTDYPLFFHRYLPRKNPGRKPRDKHNLEAVRKSANTFSQIF